MFYPKDHGPQSYMEHLAILHGQLAAAYSIISQYEEQERKGERERFRLNFIQKTRGEDDDAQADSEPTV